MNVERLIEEARSGNQRSLARLATIVESGDSASEVASALARFEPRANLVGITGPPGAGKSSLLSAVARHLSESGRTVAIVAVDPTSPLSGGAALGDRIRMTEAALLPGVFVRSLASRTRPDGLAPAVRGMMRLFDAAGFDYVFLETVGAGQNQVAVSEHVHTVVLVEAPGAGDSVQMLKAGIMELADIFAVTKGDLPGAQLVSRELRSMVTLSDPEREWKPPVVLTSSETGDGIPELIVAIDRHAAWLRDSGRMRQLERRMAVGAIRTAFSEWIETMLVQQQTEDLVDAVAGGTLDPSEAAMELIRLARPDPDRD